MKHESDLSKYNLSADIMDILENSAGFRIINSTDELSDIACNYNSQKVFEVSYDIPEKGRIVEAMVCKVKNGIAANYPDPYMRRRDPDCMIIADSMPTDKPKFKDCFGEDFTYLRQETFNWLKTQKLIVYFFKGGGIEEGLDAVVIIPDNAGFFALGLALLQGILDSENLPKDFNPRASVFVAPPFRHTYFKGKQIVVHNRTKDMYEMFSYNLYPGPSAKKGVYGMLLDLGEKEDWVTIHCSAVQVVTPYDNRITIAHEGASGGGKSEMLEYIHREKDGRILLGHNIITNDDRYLVLPRGCHLKPIVDDMALCHPSFKKNNGRLTIMDAEKAWFVRVNHIRRYGTDPYLEEITCHASNKLLFLNIDSVPGSTALIWEHTEDSPNKPCPNPRVILPKDIVPDVINKPAIVDIRSFGVRTPPCYKKQPTYGILGLFHVLPPALAWLWRLVSPRGDSNPSIIDSEGLSSEGVGSYWPFAAGRKIDQANLLLKQFMENYNTTYILCPNQYVGAWKVGFMPQWVAREYLARRGVSKFSSSQVIESRCGLLGYSIKNLMIEGQTIEHKFMQVEKQPEVGNEAYDIGANLLTIFFKDTLQSFMTKDLIPLGKKIIECCMEDGKLSDYDSLINFPVFSEEF